MITWNSNAGSNFAEGQPFFEAFAFHNIPGYADNLKVLAQPTGSEHQPAR